MPRPVPGLISFTPRLQKALGLAETDTRLSGREEIAVLNLIQAIFELSHYFFAYYAADLACDPHTVPPERWQRDFLDHSMAVRQDRWEFPVDAGEKVLAALAHKERKTVKKTNFQVC